MLKGSRTSLTDGEPPSERPRKKLSFREPEVDMGAAVKERAPDRDSKERWSDNEFRRVDESDRKSERRRKISGVIDREMEELTRRNTVDNEWRKDVSADAGRRRIERVSDGDRRRMERSLTADREWLHRRISEEDEEELESQAMKIVRTVGQAFEVCHKLSLNSPAPLDDEQDPLQDLEGDSEKDSETFSDRPRRGDAVQEVGPGDDSDVNFETPPPPGRRQLHLDMIPPPPSSGKSSSTAPAGVGETISSPLLEPLKDVGEGIPTAGTPLSAHHEIQLLREQLEQQCQQTQAAVAQVHLLRDQLAAETTARIEAQARTHQLLVHNKELLDHITALVTHLQEQERNLKPESNVTVIPQVYADMMDLQDDEISMIADNRNSGAYVTAPSSPKARHNPFYTPQQPMGSLYSLTFPSAEQQFQAQLLQRLQSLASYPPLLSPQVYPTIPAYNLCTFPSPFPYPKPRREESEPPPRLDPPPVRRARTTEQQLPPPPPAASPPPSKPRTSPLNVPPPKSPKSPSPASSPVSPPPVHSPKSSYQTAFASALSSIRTLRVAGGPDKGKKLATSDSAPITRTTSEKVTNRSELMDLVQRTAWARQTN